jgi:hypothetical protein
MTMIRPSAPVVRAMPKAVVRPAAASAPVAKPAPVRPAQAPRPVAATSSVSSGTIGAVSGAVAGGAVGYLFGGVLAAGGLSGVLPFAAGAAGAALFARGGQVIADGVAHGFKKPTLAQGVVGGAAGLGLGASVWGLTAFAAGMAGVGWLFLAAIPMGLAAAVVGGTAVGSFLPGRK